MNIENYTNDTVLEDEIEIGKKMNPFESKMNPDKSNMKKKWQSIIVIIVIRQIVIYIST